MMKTFEELMQSLEEKNWPKSWQRHFADAMIFWHQNQDAAWLTQAFADKVLPFYHLNVPEFELPYRKALIQISQDDDLKQFAFLLFYVGMVVEDFDVSAVWGWPTPHGISRMGSLMLPVVVLLGGHDVMLSRLEEKGLITQFLDDYTKDIRIHCLRGMKHEDIVGTQCHRLAPGFTLRRVRIAKLGSLTYEYGIVFKYAVKGLVSGQGKLQILSEEGFKITDEAFVGFPISRKGQRAKRRVTLPKEQWRVAFEKGSPHVTIHIPEGTDLSKEKVTASLRSLKPYLQENFPEIAAQVVTLKCWLLSQDINVFLSKKGKIRQFQNMFYRFEFVKDNDAFLRWVFGVWKKTPLQDLPEKTSLQRGVKQAMLSGKDMHLGVGCILFNDL